VEDIVADIGPEGRFRERMIAAELPERDIDELAYRLQNSMSDSIDAFLEANAGLAEVGKAAIALNILAAEERCLHEARLFSKTGNWLRHVWNTGILPCELKTLRSNRILFATFNYERTIEKFFEVAIMNFFKTSEAEAIAWRQQCIEVIHLYGDPAGMNFGQSPTTSAELRAAASGIRIVHDKVTPNDPSFGKLYEFAAEADRVLLLGFGFHKLNVQRLRLKDFVRREVPIHASTYKLGAAAVHKAHERIGHSSLVFAHPGHDALGTLLEHVDLG